MVFNGALALSVPRLDACNIFPALAADCSVTRQPQLNPGSEEHPNPLRPDGIDFKSTYFVRNGQRLTVARVCRNVKGTQNSWLALRDRGHALGHHQPYLVSIVHHPQ